MSRRTAALNNLTVSNIGNLNSAVGNRWIYAYRCVGVNIGKPRSSINLQLPAESRGADQPQLPACGQGQRQSSVYLPARGADLNRSLAVFEAADKFDAVYASRQSGWLNTAHFFALKREDKDINDQAQAFLLITGDADGGSRRGNPPNP